MLGWISIEKGLVSQDPYKSFLESLCRATQYTRSWEYRYSQEPGIVISDRLDDEILSKIIAFSNNGNEQLIFIYTHPTITIRQQLSVMAAGASRFFCWTDPNSLSNVILGQLRRWAQINRILAAPAVREHIFGNNPCWRRLLRNVIEIGRYSNAHTLLLGEPGTGKELVARLLHTVDQRPDKKNLVVLDCTTVVPDLAGSEFFGHEKGAFTNALRTRDGMFEQANGGTLFLDEVGELPGFLQASLLRVVQEKTYKRVGGDTWQTLNFRLVSATNRNLEAEQQKGKFRQDFFHRIASATFTLPPLRDRKDDIPLLLQNFLHEEFQHEPPTVHESVYQILREYDFPGNVRELRQLVKAMCGRYNGSGEISANEIPRPYIKTISERYFTDYSAEFCPPIRHALQHGMDLKTLKEYVSDIARNLMLQEEHGNLKQAAERLGITVRSLQQFRAKSDP